MLFGATWIDHVGMTLSDTSDGETQTQIQIKRNKTSQAKQRVPWTARRPNQSILKEISPKGNLYSLEGLMLQLKLQYFGHLM